ncbi:MAG: hypothetical protein ACK4NY_01705 [Spirosomataceae bacterium]
MKKAIIIIAAMAAANAYSQNTKPIHISVVQGLSTQGKESKNTDYHLSFNLFSGTVRSIKGVEVGTLYNQNNGDMTGFQTSGFLNLTKGNVVGFQNSGVTNISGDVKGFQDAGISNHAKNLIGLQVSGIANTAKEVKGGQITGIFNRASTLKGLQIGLINYADSVEKGGGIGLLNIYKKGGYREIEVSFADYQNIGLSLKTGTKSIYSIVTLGYNFTPETLLISGFGIGTLRELRQNWFLKPELIMYNYNEDDFEFRTTSNSTHLKIGIMRKVNKLGFTLMPSIYYANIPKNLEGSLTEISRIKPFSQTKNGRFGFGLSLGIAFLK